MENKEAEIKLSVEKIIDLIRTVRNDLVKDFLDEDKLKSYFIENYDKNLTKIKTEFIKKELRELLISPVDLTISHNYATLINNIRESNSASLAQGNQEIFYTELDSIFAKYNY